VITRIVSWVFYSDDSEHYTSGSAQVFLYGDRGYMYAIHGPGFFKSFVPECREFMDQYGLRSLEGYMSPANARSVRMAFRTKKDFTVSLGDVVRLEDHDVRWVAVTLLN